MNDFPLSLHLTAQSIEVTVIEASTLHVMRIFNPDERTKRILRDIEPCAKINFIRITTGEGFLERSRNINTNFVCVNCFLDVTDDRDRWYLIMRDKDQ